MAGKTKIEWTDRTWNPIVGCSIVSPGCTHCYAMRQAWRLKHMEEARTGDPACSHYFGTTQVINSKPVWTGKVSLAPEHILTQPLRWQRPRRIFVNSMGDLFHEDVPDEWIDRVFAIMALAPQHTFQVLTKRSERMRSYLSAARAHPVGLEVMHRTLLCMAGNPHSEVGSGVILQGDIAHLKLWPLPNVWLGVSTEDQRRAEERIPDLLATPAAVRFVSAEPLLGPLDLRQWIRSYGCGCGWGGDDPLSYCPDCDWRGRDAYYGDACPNCGKTLADYNACPECDERDGDSVTFGPNSRLLDWIIAGGESGPGARPMHPDWARSIRDQCASAGVAFHFKQWGQFKHGSTLGNKPSQDVIVFNDGVVLRDTRRTACLSEDRARGWAGRSPEMMARVGKKRAGRVLDGREHNDFPKMNEVGR